MGNLRFATVIPFWPTVYTLTLYIRCIEVEIIYQKRTLTQVPALTMNLCKYKETFGWISIDCKEPSSCPHGCITFRTNPAKGKHVESATVTTNHLNFPFQTTSAEAHNPQIFQMAAFCKLRCFSTNNTKPLAAKTIIPMNSCKAQSPSEFRYIGSLRTLK